MFSLCFSCQSMLDKALLYRRTDYCQNNHNSGNHLA